MKLIYFHGFASSGASGTVDLLRRLLPSAEVIAPDISMDPAEALPELKVLVENEQPDLIIGTSMGGMYAQQMRGFKRILVVCMPLKCTAICASVSIRPSICLR